MSAQPPDRLSRRTAARHLAFAALAVTGAVRAQPLPSGSGPIRMLVGFPAGGTIDVGGRLLADRLKDELGVPVVVESRVGAGGQLAAQALKQAAPDGRTLMLAPDHTMVVVPLTLKSPGYEVARDFVPVAQVARYLGALAVASSTGVRNVAEYVAWLKANPGQASVGVPAPGSLQQFSLATISRAAGVPITPVPYRGSAPLVQDLAAGQIPAGITALGDFLEFNTAGKLRVIATIDSQRAPQLPDVPTFTEQGMKLDFNFWLGLFAPAGTSPALVQRLNSAVAKVLAQPDVRERMGKLVFEPVTGTPAAMSERIALDTRYWEPIIKSSGWVPQ
ncbi:MAG: Bug family tripartite tricarboxylate transporter substrate binding protein [Ramlibacter sp.]|nr:Bug family tripartite tricarboxylate transporter substrate binding protein [Ramlibacter sp.]